MSNIFDLFKKIETKSDTSPVTYIVAGLGNIGKQYERTRHNAGFMAIDKIADDAGVKNALVNGKDLKNVVLADAVVEGDADGFKKELDINGVACTVILNKVNK